MMKYLFLLLLFLSVVQVNAQGKKYTLVLDAGHGGRDPGNLASAEGYSNEKDINLKVCKKVNELLTNSDLSGLNIIATRDTDVYVSLEKRTTLANNNNADFFVSIHANSNPKAEIYGSRIHIYANTNKLSYAMAKSIENELSARKESKSLGIMDTRENGMNLYVLKNTNMVAILIEMGFMSNAWEEEYLNSESGQDELANCIYKGLYNYLTGPSLVLSDNSANKQTSPKKIKKNIPVKNNTGSIYRVQIKASVSQIPMKNFKKIGYEVLEIITENDTFKYRYQVGNEGSMKDANILRKKLAAKGFKDAFVVKIK